MDELLAMNDSNAIDATPLAYHDRENKI